MISLRDHISLSTPGTKIKQRAGVGEERHRTSQVSNVLVTIEWDISSEHLKLLLRDHSFSLIPMPSFVHSICTVVVRVVLPRRQSCIKIPVTEP